MLHTFDMIQMMCIDSTDNCVLFFLLLEYEMKQ